HHFIHFEDSKKHPQKEEMKDRMQRCVVLPFSFGCSKQSSVAVADSTHQHKKPNQLIKSYGDEEREEREAEMEIGFPTDVKHLSHIGVDGTMTTFNVSSSSFPFAGLHLTAV
ncbi:unnamed protein product, partial [Brassica rapa subsp. trilocularis]